MKNTTLWLLLGITFILTILFSGLAVSVEGAVLTYNTSSVTAGFTNNNNGFGGTGAQMMQNFTATGNYLTKVGLNISNFTASTVGPGTYVDIRVLYNNQVGPGLANNTNISRSYHPLATLDTQNGLTGGTWVEWTLNVPVLLNISQNYTLMFIFLNSSTGNVNAKQTNSNYFSGISSSVAGLLARPEELLTAMYFENVTNPYQISGVDAHTEATLLNLSVNLTNYDGDSFNYSNTTGIIYASNVTTNSTKLWNITLYSSDNGGYYVKTITNQNVSNTSLSIRLEKAYISAVTFSNNITNSGKSYFRSLDYSVTVSNCTGTNSVYVLVNGSYKTQKEIDCGAGISNSFATGNYIHDMEGQLNISFFLTNNTYAHYNTSNTTFYSDLYAPNISIKYNTSTGFITSTTLNISLQCNDSVYSPLMFELVHNANVLQNKTYVANTTNLNQTNQSNGINTITGYCSDLFSNTTDDETFSIYSGNLLLWDELFNAPFDMTFVSGAKIWTEGNGTYYDLKGAGKNNISVAFSNISKYRIDLNYSGGVSVYRYIDLEYLTTSPIKVCANRDGQSYYQQLIYSSVVKPVFLINSYVGCYIIADETRFAYQDAYAVSGYTINSDYYLYEIQSNAFLSLASIDGTNQVRINLDNLEFTLQGFTLNLRDDALTFSPSTTIPDTTAISYRNLQDDNHDVYLEIYRVDNGTLLLNVTNITTPNDWQVNFIWSAYPNTNDTTLFRARAYVTKDDGTQEIITSTFDGLSRSGILPSALGIMISIGLIIGGLTMFITPYVFGYIGMLITALALVINSITVPNDVTFILWFVYGSILLFQLLITLSGNKNTGVQ